LLFSVVPDGPESVVADAAPTTAAVDVVTTSSVVPSKEAIVRDLKQRILRMS
jgi:hypothetical protein